MTIYKFFLVCFFLTLLTITRSSKKCINVRNDYENYLGTKSPYRVVANLTSNEIKYDGKTTRDKGEIIN